MARLQLGHGPLGGTRLETCRHTLHHRHRRHYQVGLFGPEQEQGEHAATDEHTTGTSNAGGHSVVLCQTYYRCRAARDVSFADKAVETSRTNPGFITGGEQRRIGAFDGQGTAINLCFVL